MQPTGFNATDAVTKPPSSRGWPRSTRRRVLFLGLYVLFLMGLSWSGWAAYWWLTASVPPTSAPDVWDHFYPVLRQSGVRDAKITSDDGQLDVLMLGASTIEHGWGNIEELLRDGLKKAFGDRVRVFNLAMIAHTSRDSALKYSYLKDKPFDVILIYDGFNDCRMNNCPREIFRDDYSHCHWYESFTRRLKAGKVSLPAAVLTRAAEGIGLGPPDPQMVEYGAELKTPPAFEKNLREILNGGRQQQSLMVLSSFAFHIPENYSEERFKKHELDYANNDSAKACALDMWGTRKAVVAGVEAHNAVLGKLAKEFSRDCVWVDQNRLIPRDGRNFIDPCHFTRAGCRLFVDNMLPPLIERLRERGWKSSE